MASQATIGPGARGWSTSRAREGEEGEKDPHDVMQSKRRRKHTGGTSYASACRAKALWGYRNPVKGYPASIRKQLHQEGPDDVHTTAQG